jgi:hypothetical protein
MAAALTRLWFRTDEVLALAEHAMNCPTQARTGAQSAALAADGPALTWTSNGGMDLLTSNGIPGWHDPNGALQHAEAYTWQHRTGGYGTAWQPGYSTAHLPLTASPNETVIDTLRAAARTGRYWVSVDVHPGDGYLIAAHRIAAHTTRREVVPEGARWHRDTVTCPEVGGTGYPAWVATDYRADAGGLLARFDRATTDVMVGDLHRLHHHPASMPGEYPLARFDGDTVVLLTEHDDGDTVSYRETDQVEPDADGRYPIGAYLWPWQVTP